jgi:anti-sigma factor RsiW
MGKRIVLGLLGLLFAATAARADWFDYENRWEKRYRHRTLNPAGYVRGHLVDPAGQGVPGLVALTTPSGAIVFQAYAASIQGGRFDMGRVAPGRYLLRVTSLGPITSELERPAPVEIVVEKGQTVHPVLTAQPGAPVELGGR